MNKMILKIPFFAKRLPLWLCLLGAACSKSPASKKKAPKTSVPLALYVLSLPTQPEVPDLAEQWKARLQGKEHPQIQFDQQDSRFRRPSRAEWLVQADKDQVLDLLLAWPLESRGLGLEADNSLKQLRDDLQSATAPAPFEMNFKVEGASPVSAVPTKLLFFDVLVPEGQGLLTQTCQQVRGWVYSTQILAGARPSTRTLVPLHCQLHFETDLPPPPGLSLNQFPLPIVYGKKIRFPFRRRADLSNLRLLRQLGRKP